MDHTDDLVIVYTRKTNKRNEVTVAGMMELGHFVYFNQPINIIAVRQATQADKEQS